MHQKIIINLKTMMRITKKLLSNRLMLSLLGSLFSLGVVAQNIQVHGEVKDESGEAVIGASVMQKGNNNGTHEHRTN